MSESFRFYDPSLFSREDEEETSFHIQAAFYLLLKNHLNKQAITPEVLLRASVAFADLVRPRVPAEALDAWDSALRAGKEHDPSEAALAWWSLRQTVKNLQESEQGCSEEQFGAIFFGLRIAEMTQGENI